MSRDHWFEDVPVIGQLEQAQLQRKLAEVDPEAARAIAASGVRTDSQRFGVRDWLGAKSPPWKHTAHAFGFIGVTGEGEDGCLPILHVGAIQPDERLRRAPLRVTLDGLRVAGYPGGGTHRVLFDFYAQNHTASGPEHVHFNATYKVREGERAAVLNFPLFLNLRAGDDGLTVRCLTVNVKNDEDEQRLAFLESDVFRSGLKLAETAQPAIAPLSSLAVGLTKMIVTRHRNVAVQDVHLGLDFGGPRTGGRLAVGSYLAVQVPEAFSRAWSWLDWVYDIHSGQVVERRNRSSLIPYNYFILGVGLSAEIVGRKGPATRRGRS